MISFIIAAVSLLLATIFLVAEKAYFALPLIELKRRAINGEPFAHRIYPLVAYQESLRLLLWLFITIFASISLVLFSILAPTILAIVVVFLWLVLAFFWLPNRLVKDWMLKLALKLSPLVSLGVNYSYPLLRRLEGHPKVAAHSGLYESEDLLRLIAYQAKQVDNRIPSTQLKRLTKLIQFETAKVEDYLKPWAKVMTLSTKDTIGPKLLDELHRSGQSAFPINQAGGQIAGILNRGDLGLSTSGKVEDYLRPVEYIGTNAPMEQALARFALSGAPILLVKDEEGQIAGILSLRAALSSLLAVDRSVQLIDNEHIDKEEEVITGGNSESIDP